MHKGRLYRLPLYILPRVLLALQFLLQVEHVFVVLFPVNAKKVTHWGDGGVVPAWATEGKFPPKNGEMEEPKESWAGPLP